MVIKAISGKLFQWWHNFSYKKNKNYKSHDKASLNFIIIKREIKAIFAG